MITHEEIQELLSNIVYEETPKEYNTLTETRKTFIQPHEVIECTELVQVDREMNIVDIDNDKTVLIDADTLVYKACSSSQQLNIGTNEEEVILQLAVTKAHSYIKEIMDGSGCGKCILFFTGQMNFRHIVYVGYKESRTTVHGRDLVATELMESYKAYHGEDYNMEADDLVIAYYDAVRTSGNYTISSIDKDVYMAIDGKHWNPYTKRGYTNKVGKLIPAIEAKFVEVSKLEAFKMPYYQCLMGDKTDGIKGVDGVGKAGATKILAELELGDTLRANYLVLHEYVKSMCTLDAYHEFEAGLKVKDAKYNIMPLGSSGLGEEVELENNARVEIIEAVKMMESTMRAVSMRQAKYNFIDDTFELNLWSFPKTDEGVYLWD